MRKSSHNDGKITKYGVLNYSIFSYSCSSGLGLWLTFDSCLRKDVNSSVVEGEENENEARKNRLWALAFLRVLGKQGWSPPMEASPVEEGANWRQKVMQIACRQGLLHPVSGAEMKGWR